MIEPPVLKAALLAPATFRIGGNRAIRQSIRHSSNQPGNPTTRQSGTFQICSNQQAIGQLGNWAIGQHLPDLLAGGEVDLVHGAERRAAAPRARRAPRARQAQATRRAQAST
eukprot:2693352-Prymnesium_polylepis.1